MSSTNPIRRRCRSVMLSTEEHRRFQDMGGSKWLREAIEQAWAKLPEAVKAASDQRAADPFWSSK